MGHFEGLCNEHSFVSFMFLDLLEKQREKQIHERNGSNRLLRRCVGDKIENCFSFYYYYFPFPPSQIRDGTAKSETEKKTSSLSTKPIWDRHLLTPTAFKPTRNNNSNNSLSHPEFNRVSDLCGFLAHFSNERLVPTSFIFNKASLNELKKVAFSTSRVSESNDTAFEILLAHIWRSWARALNLPSNQTLKLLFSINVRDRVKPRVP